MKLESIEEIEAKIEGLKDESSILSKIDSKSRYSVWGAVKWIVAVFSNLVQKMLISVVQDIEAMIATIETGRLDYYERKVLMFEYNNGSLTYENGKIFYKHSYEDLRIIKSVSAREIVENERVVILIKVAKQNDGSLAPLSPDERGSLGRFIDKVKFAGVETRIVSLPPNKISGDVDVYLLNDCNRQELVNTLNNILSATINSRFGDIHYVSDIVDEFKRNICVRDAVFRLKIDNELIGANSFELSAGYIVIDNLVYNFI